MHFKLYFAIVIIVGFPLVLTAQSLQGDPLEYYFRILQISDRAELEHSYNIRPISKNPDFIATHPWQQLFRDYYTAEREESWNHNLSFYEPVWFQSYNTALPRGVNDGAIWQGRGYNSALSLGLQFQNDFLKISFKPQVGLSQNLNFDLGPYEPPIITIPSDGINEQASEYAYRDFKGRYDYVQRFGDQSFTWWDFGPSEISIHAKNLKLGFSNKQLWTGPAIHNSLQFGYSAPGFRHLHFGTYQPVNTLIGSFEFAYIFGRMVSSDYFINDKVRSQSVNSLIVSYSPGFSRNFHIGGVRTFFHHYPESFQEYRLMASKIFEFLFRDSQDDWDPDNQIANLFFRYAVPAYGIDFYGEYGRNDHNADLRDFRAQFNHARAYTIGMIKVSNLGRQRILATNIEITQTEAMRAGLTRGEKNIGGRLGGWYGHAHQVMGFTNGGQILGSGYGAGINSQIIKFDIFDRGGRVGLKLARLTYHNNRLDQSFEEIQLINEDEIERWEVRNTELLLGLETTLFLLFDIELTASLEQSYVYNHHNLKGNDLWNTRLELTLRKNIGGWLR